MKRKSEDYVKGLVSVIIPVYNCEKYIDRTLHSVFTQTYKNIEIILVNDQSKDKSADIIKKYQKVHPEIIYFLQPQNMGAGYARNKALELARGQYIAFLDSDDLWESQKIEKQLNAIKEGHPFVYCAYDFIDDTGSKIGNKTIIKTEVTYEDELTKTYISTPTVIYDRKFFNDPYMPLRRTGQDYAFWLLLLHKTDAYGIDEALVHVRRRRDSLSKNKLQSLIDVYEVQTKFEKIGKINAVWNTFRYLLYAIKKKLIKNKR